MRFDPEKIYAVCGFALYPIWGLLSSALLLTRTNLPSRSGQLLSAVICIVVAGILPVALHIYEAHPGRTMFSACTFDVRQVFVLRTMKKLVRPLVEDVVTKLGRPTTDISVLEIKGPTDQAEQLAVGRRCAFVGFGLAWIYLTYI